MSPQVESHWISMILQLSFLETELEILPKALRIDFIELEVTQHSAKLSCWNQWRLPLIEFSGIQFPEDKAKYFRWVQRVSLIPLNTSDHKLLKKLEDLFNFESVGRDWGEEVEVAPMRVGEFHHDHGVELYVELESLGELIEKVNPPV